MRETIESIASHYGIYFTWRIEDGRIKTKAKNKAITDGSREQDGKIPAGV